MTQPFRGGAGAGRLHTSLPLAARIPPGRHRGQGDESTVNSDVIFCDADHQACVDLILLSFLFLVYKRELVTMASEDACECGFILG